MNQKLSLSGCATNGHLYLCEKLSGRLSASLSNYSRLTLLFVLVVAHFAAGSAVASSGPVQTGLLAQADSAITAASNPAGLSRLEQTEWLGQLNVFVSDSTFEQDTPSGPEVTDSDGSLVAPFIYYARPLNDKWTVGGSVTGMGFGEDVGGEGPGRYLIDEWALVLLKLAPAVSYRINEKWSVGAALNINYTYYSFETAVFNGVGNPDGRMEIEADDINFSPQIGLLYEFSDTTRFGLNWTGESNPELSDTPEYTGGTGPLEEVKIESTMPQMIGAGVWHQFSGGSAVTVDALWVEFSKFGMSEVYLNNGSIETKNQDFEDAWLFTLGYTYPISPKWLLKGGVLYSTQFIKDENRTQNFKMDQMMGVGVGAEYQWGENINIGLNFNYYDFGEAPIEADVPGFGTFTGRYTKHDAYGLDFTIRWRRP
jgi:long-chain fatty acid transport protein